MAALLLPVQVLAQAGSTSPLIYASVSDYFSSTNTGSASQKVSEQTAMRPGGILKLPAEERYLVWIELEQARMTILEQQHDGGLIPRRVIPVSIGKNGIGKEYEGDKRTPLGVYRFTSYLDDRDIDDFYGLGAYPLNYPNVQDRRQQRTGSGIWLHGLPKGVNERPFLDSDGCVIIDNVSLQEMQEFINAGITHVVLSRDEIQWQPASSFQGRSQSLENDFYQWIKAWEERDNEAYLAYYADSFSDFNRNLSQWSSYKTRVNDGKSWIEVDISSLSFIADPHNSDLVTVRYYQQYKSSNYNWKGWKEQLWIETGNGWQILYEGNG